MVAVCDHAILTLVRQGSDVVLRLTLAGKTCMPSCQPTEWDYNGGRCLNRVEPRQCGLHPRILLGRRTRSTYVLDKILHPSPPALHIL